jgi:hypothetical protein
MNRAVILLSLACTAVSAFAADNSQVYKWTDANGVLHFSDAPPPSDTKNVQSLHLVGGTTATTEGTGSDAGNPATPATPGAVADAANARAKDCEQAHRNLKMLQSDLPVSEVDANGKIKPIDDKERDARIAGVMDRIAETCSTN